MLDFIKAIQQSGVRVLKLEYQASPKNRKGANQRKPNAFLLADSSVLDYRLSSHLEGFQRRNAVEIFEPEKSGIVWKNGFRIFLNPRMLNEIREHLRNLNK